MIDCVAQRRYQWVVCSVEISQMPDKRTSCSITIGKSDILGIWLIRSFCYCDAYFSSIKFSTLKHILDHIRSCYTFLERYNTVVVDSSRNPTQSWSRLRSLSGRCLGILQQKHGQASNEVPTAQQPSPSDLFSASELDFDHIQ